MLRREIFFLVELVSEPLSALSSNRKYDKTHTQSRKNHSVSTMPTKLHHNRILALHPAKRSLGVCVMEQRATRKREILVAGVKTFRGEGKAKQARDYVAGLLRDVEPSVLVMEERYRAGERRGKAARRTGNHGGSKAREHRERGSRRKHEPGKPIESRTGDTFADKLYEFIGKAARKSSVKLRLHSAMHIKRSLCGDESATWFQVEQAVAEQYSELRGYLCDKDSEREKYWRKMDLEVQDMEVVSVPDFHIRGCIEGQSQCGPMTRILIIHP
jgi:hypothetical protein